MNDFERQLQAMQLAAPSETLDRRMQAVFSAEADSSAGGARCPPLDRPCGQTESAAPVVGRGALSLPNGQRASERLPESSNQRVEVNALHLRSPESGRTQMASASPSRRRISLFALLAGLGAAAAIAGFVLLSFRPMPHQIDASPNVVAYRVEATGLMRQFLTETPASQRPLPKFTVGVGSPAISPFTAKSNPSS
jgi:hypothetical protein